MFSRLIKRCPAQSAGVNRSRASSGMISDEPRRRVKPDSFCTGGKLTCWSGLRRLGQGAGHDQCVDPGAVRGLVIPPPPSRACKARRFVKRNRSRVFRRNLQKGAIGPAQPRLIQKPGHKPAPKAKAAGVGSDRDGQKLGLACHGPAKQETRVPFDQKKGQGVGQSACKSGSRPRRRRTKAARVQCGQSLGRHGRITGGGSDGGAASAPRR